MKVRVLNASNRIDIQRRYVDHILGSMDFMEIKDSLRDYLSLEKDRQSDAALQAEILHEAPDILVDNWEDFDEPTLLVKERHHA